VEMKLYHPDSKKQPANYGKKVNPTMAVKGYKKSGSNSGGRLIDREPIRNLKHR
jgi:hypothetical protein